MKSGTMIALFVIVMAAMSALAGTARAQSLAIVPSETADVASFLDGSCEVWLPPDPLPGRTIPLRAFFRAGSSLVDVTNAVSWQCEPPTRAYFAAPGILVRTATGRVRVTVSSPTLQSDSFEINLPLPPLNANPPGDDADNENLPPGADGGDPFSDEQTKARIRDFLVYLGTRGFRMAVFYDVLERIRAMDNSQFRNGGVLSPEVSGLWFSPGIKRGARDLTAIATSLGVIVLGHQSINALNADQHLSADEMTLLHEMLHAVISKNKVNVPDIKVNFHGANADLEEHIAHQFELIADTINDIIGIIDDGQLTQQEMARFWALIQKLQQLWNEIRALDPAAWDAIMRALGWDDLDGNGIPDWLDTLICNKVGVCIIQINDIRIQLGIETLPY